MAGFFSSSEVASKQPIGLLPKCGACKLHTMCKFKKPEVAGKGKRKILLITDNTTHTEDDLKSHFYGDAWDLLKQEFERLGVDVENDCWKTSAVICHAGKDKLGKPIILSSDHADYCYPNLKKTIKDLNPDIIIPMGPLAMRSIVKATWKENVGEYPRWPGWLIPCQNPNAWVCPVYSPHWLLKQRERVATVWFRKHLKAILALKGKPWPNGPRDYAKEITVITDPDKAAKELLRIIKNGRLFSFDYEANALKPEIEGFKVYSASVCADGKETLSFPWRGAVVDVMRRFLASKKKLKIAANLKYEDRVTKVIFGKRVQGWHFDTMLAAHVIDCRSGITGLKFLSFVYLGAPDYNYHIESLLRGSDGKRINDIDRIGTADLLLYNGLDSLLEYDLAIAQAKQLKITL